MPYISADYVARADSGGKSLTPPAGASLAVFVLLSNPTDNIGDPQTLTWRGMAGKSHVYNYNSPGGSGGGSLAIWTAPAGGGAGTLAWDTPNDSADCEVLWLNSCSEISRDTGTEDITSDNNTDITLDPTAAGDFCVFATVRGGSGNNTVTGIAIEVLDTEDRFVAYAIAAGITATLGAQSGSTDHNWASAAVALKPPTGRSPFWF